VEVKLAGSKGEARRLVEQGGVKLDGNVIKDINQIIEITKKGVLLQKGKRGFIRIFKK
jgi:tyrosyl-tRNA synthetase